MRLWHQIGYIDIAGAVSSLFANACKYTSEALKSSGILDIYEEAEMQYAAQFWGLVHACGAEKMISGEEIDELLSRHIECLAPILENDKLVKLFDAEIRKGSVRPGLTYMCPHGAISLTP